METPDRHVCVCANCRPCRAAAEWFTSKPAVPEKMSVTVFKVTGETNTDDLSPAPDAWSRPDIPLHALAMLKIPREGITDAPKQIEELKKKGLPLAYVGDVVGTGSSRKSATNSILWYMVRYIMLPSACCWYSRSSQNGCDEKAADLETL